jgi:hypothetical protein
MAITTQEIEALDAAHGRTAVVRAKRGEWEVVFRKPKRMEWKRFQGAKDTPEALEQLCKTLVVFPSKEAFDALLEEWPGLPVAAAEAIGELAGVSSKEDTGK